MFQRPQWLPAASIILISASASFTWSTATESNDQMKQASYSLITWEEITESSNLLLPEQENAAQLWAYSNETGSNIGALLSIPEKSYVPAAIRSMDHASR